MLIKELRGTESTQDACAKMRANCQKSTEQMKKVPTIILSVSYKGVKFIDATNKNIIAEHEIRNISCAAQDPEDLSTFAYITKDLKSNHHYCHVFTAFDVVSTVFGQIKYFPKRTCSLLKLNLQLRCLACLSSVKVCLMCRIFCRLRFSELFLYCHSSIKFRTPLPLGIQTAVAQLLTSLFRFDKSLSFFGTKVW